MSSNFISAAIYYSAVFVEVHDVYDSKSEQRMKDLAEIEFKKNVNLNGYSIHSVHIDKVTAKDAVRVVGSVFDLGDTRLYKVELK